MTGRIKRLGWAVGAVFDRMFFDTGRYQSTFDATTYPASAPIATIAAVDGSTVTVREHPGDCDYAVWCTSCSSRYVDGRCYGETPSAKEKAAARHATIEAAVTHAASVHGGEPR